MYNDNILLRNNFSTYLSQDTLRLMWLQKHLFFVYYFYQNKYMCIYFMISRYK